MSDRRDYNKIYNRYINLLHQNLTSDTNISEIDIYLTSFDRIIDDHLPIWKIRYSAEGAPLDSDLKSAYFILPMNTPYSLSVKNIKILEEAMINQTLITVSVMYDQDNCNYLLYPHVLHTHDDGF